MKPTGSSYTTRPAVSAEIQQEILKHIESNFPDIESIIYFEVHLNYLETEKCDKTNGRFNEKKIQLLVGIALQTSTLCKAIDYNFYSLQVATVTANHPGGDYLWGSGSGFALMFAKTLFSKERTCWHKTWVPNFRENLSFT